MGTRRKKQLLERKNRHICQFCGTRVNSHECVHAKCCLDFVKTDKKFYDVIEYLEKNNFAVLDFSFKRMIERLIRDG